MTDTITLETPFELEITEEFMADILENKSAEITFNPTSSFEALSDGNKRAVVHLVKAAYILNDVFLKQDHPDNMRAKQFLLAAAETGKPVYQQALTFFNMFNGLHGTDKYSPSSAPVYLFKNTQIPQGSGYYPPDITKEELIDYLLTHPEQIAEILNSNTVVIRDGNRLIAQPYSVAFNAEMAAAARELQKAADHTDHAGLAHYLRLQARALIEDTDPEVMYEADKAWIELEGSPIQFTIGRENSYDVFSADIAAEPRIAALIKERGISADPKDKIGCCIGLVNQASAHLLNLYAMHQSEFGKTLPLYNLYKSQIPNSTPKTPRVDIDIVAFTGRYANLRGGIVTANILPNDDKLAVKRGVGRRQIFHKDMRDVSDPEINLKILENLFVRSQHHILDVIKGFNFIIGHEGGHDLGPLTTFEGQNKDVTLGTNGAKLEENKADLISILWVAYFAERGIYSIEEAQEIYMVWIFRQLPKKQPTPNEVHTNRALMQLNYLFENGVLKFTDKKKLKINFEKIPRVVEKMLTDVHKLQLDGDPQKAAAFVDKYQGWNENMQAIAETIMGLKPKLYRTLKQPLAEKLLTLVA